MKKIKVGDVWQGNSYANMINEVLGTKYLKYQRATVPIEKFGLTGVAWFVYMNGTIRNGHHNILLDDGDTIKEYIDVNGDRSGGLDYPIRLSFMRDPDNDGNIYRLMFVGYFMRSEVRSDNLVRTYKKVNDSITLKV